MLLFFSTSATAQQTSIPHEVKILKMPKFSTGNFPKKSVAISRIAILQNVWDSVNLGYVQKGVDDQMAVLQPAKPLTEFLQDQFNKIYKEDFKRDGAVMLWVVKDLRVSERTFFSKQVAYIRVNADSYISYDGDKYALTASIDSVLLDGSGVDVTNWHGQRIENVFRLLLASTLKNSKESVAQPPVFTLQQIQEAIRHDLDIPILNASSYEEGLYKNFQEFLANKPSTANYLPVAVEKNKVKFITANDQNQMDTLEAWGISKAGELYKYQDGALIPIEKYSNGFIISDYVQKVNRRNSNMYFAGMVGGLAGALISNGVENSRKAGKVHLVTGIPYLKKNYPEASCINMKTGELSF